MGSMNTPPHNGRWSGGTGLGGWTAPSQILPMLRSKQKVDTGAFKARKVR